MIELRQFRQFIAVAEEMSFRRAAKRLNMAQPPLTAAIRRIEEELGAVLLERGNRVTRLTQPGMIFLEEARRTVAQAERTLQATKRAAAGLTGSLRVTFVASAAHHILPRLLTAFRADHPDVELKLHEGTTARQVTALLEDRADLGLLVLPPPSSAGLELEIVQRSQLVAALPEHHPLAQSETLSLRQLSSEPWILFPPTEGPGLYSRIMLACAQAGFVPRVAQEALQMETISGLVAGGLGVALIPGSLAALGRRGVVFRDLSGDGAPIDYQLAAAWRADEAPAPALEAFIATCREFARKDA